jgi:hypothetical protein
MKPLSVRLDFNLGEALPSFKVSLDELCNVKVRANRTI